MGQPPTIVLCRCEHYRMVTEQALLRMVNALDAAHMAYQTVSDLCEMAARNDPLLSQWAHTPHLTVVACYGRAVKWLFHRAGAALDDDRICFHNARSDDVDNIIASLTAEPQTSDATAESQNLGQKGPWIPWYPVIDYDRCINCKQCLNFCLFGVYGLSPDDAVHVVKPDGCKTNCPACARLCPERAIIFPKYGDSPISGDEVDENAIDRQKDTAELEALLGGDIHEILRKRKARKLFAREQTDDSLSPQQKLARLASLQSQLDIPQEVLDALSQNLPEKNNDCPNSDICPGDCKKQGGR